MRQKNQIKGFGLLVLLLTCLSLSLTATAQTDFTETKFHGLRYGDWKLLFVEQDDWFRSPQLSLSTPIVTNLKLDPFERFHEARGYNE
jgi:hypothetical protein